MKRVRLLSAFIITLLLLAALPAQPARGAAPYSEKITVYVAGSSALWFMSFTGINASNPHVAAAEAVKGVHSYNLTAIKTITALSDFQVFGPRGYNLLPVPYVPGEGLFLTVKADSYSAAASAAQAFDSYLYCYFASYSNSTGTYVFASPLAFNTIVPPTMFKLVPSSMGGFASLLTSSAMGSLLSPVVTLGWQSSTSTHTLTVGSVASGALDRSLKLAILTYFGGHPTSISSSNKSTSSTIRVELLDGVLNSTDHGASFGNAGGVGTYSLSLAPGAKVKSLNATLLQSPVEVLVTRLVDKGVLHTGDNDSVTLTFTDLSNSTALSNLKFADSWWSSGGLFTLVHGNSSGTVAKISAGHSSSQTYVVKYKGTATQPLTIPASTVTYAYSYGSSNFTGRAISNPITISLGADAPALYTYVSPTGGFAASVGGSISLNIVVENVGDLTASSVSVAGQEVSGLAPREAHTFTATLKASGLLGIDFTRNYTVNYLTPGGQKESAYTNALTAIFSHSSMKIAQPFVIMDAAVSQLPGGAGMNVTLAFLAANGGSSNITSIRGTTAVPAGLECGTVKGKGLACSSGTVTLNYTDVVPRSVRKASVEFDLKNPTNYLFSPVTYSVVSSQDNFTGSSNPVAVPSGLVLTKQFSPSPLFQGMASRVTVEAFNTGPVPVFNVTLRSFPDSFDSITSGTAADTAATIASGGNLTLNYGVRTLSTVSGGQTSKNVSANFIFGGRAFSLASNGPVVGIYAPVGATVHTSPTSPSEGAPFFVEVTLTNPSPINVTNVVFSLPIPPGVTISNLIGASYANKSLNLEVGSLAGHGSYSGNATVQASSGVTIPFAKASLTFSYSGLRVSGKLPSQGIVIGEDVLRRYVLPVILVLVAMLGATVYLRRRVAISPVSRQ